MKKPKPNSVIVVESNPVLCIKSASHSINPQDTAELLGVEGVWGCSRAGDSVVGMNVLALVVVVRARVFEREPDMY